MQVLKDKIYDKLKEGMIKYSLDKSFARSSIREISRYAGISVGNIYHYYKNKEELFDAVIEPVWEKLQGIQSYYSMNFESNSEDIANAIASDFAPLIDEFSVELTILFSKADESRYEKEISKLKEAVVKALKAKVNKDDFLLILIVNNLFSNLVTVASSNISDNDKKELLYTVIHLYVSQLK